MDLFFYYITWLGSILVLFPAAVALVVLMRRVLQLSDSILLLGGVLGATLIAHIMKLLISRPRPAMSQDMLVEMPSDFSFPSAHTAQAVSFFFSVAIVASREVGLQSAVSIWTMSGLTMLLVGYSRIYLKVHYLSDVVMGAVLGIFWVLFLNWCLQTFLTGGTNA